MASDDGRTGFGVLGHQLVPARDHLQIGQVGQAGPVGLAEQARRPFERARRKALDNPAAVTRPILILAPQPLSTAAKAFCDKAASCETAGLPSAGGAPHLEQDSIRSLWFERLSSFLAEAGVEAAASTAAPRPHEM